MEIYLKCDVQVNVGKSNHCNNVQDNVGASLRYTRQRT